MKKFSLELASSILHLEMQKEQILKENEMVKRLCECRMELFNNYINVCQLFFIRLTSQIIKFLDDFDKSKALSTTCLKKWYMSEMYDKLYTKKYTSNKMILLFKLLQSKSDKDFFDDFENRFKNLIVSYNKNNENNENNFLEKFHELYSDILDWMETHILNILSFKISCDKINENILIDYTKYLDRCKINKHDDCQWSIPRCQSLDLVINEDIHIYITDEILNSNMLIEYFNILKKYHNNINNIDFIIDFILYDKENTCQLTESLTKCMLHIVPYFKSFSIINYSYVDFGAQYDFIKNYIN